MTTATGKARGSRLRQRRRLAQRRERGATLIEYVALLTLVAIPCIAAALACFASVVLWYSHFVDIVSQGTP